MAFTDVSSLVSLVNGKTDGGLYVWQNPANLFTDTGGTTAVATAGVDTIARVNDLSSFSRPLLQSNSARRPLWNQSGSLGYGMFSGGATGVADANGKVMRTAAAATSTSQPFVTFVLVRPTSSAQNGMIVGPFSGSSAGLFLWVTATSNVDVYSGADVFTANNSVPVNSITAVIGESNSGTSRVWVNGVQDTSDPTPNTGATASNHITVGNDGAATYTSPFFNGDILAVGWFAGTASAGDITTISNVLTALATSSTPAPVFSVAPSISPGSGTAGSTLFTATDGTSSNTTGKTRRWLLGGVSIGTGTTVTPASAGSLVLEVTATGAGGSTIANSPAVTVSAAATVTIRRGGMRLGMGMGLGFSGGGGGGTPTPSPSVSWPTGVTAPTLMPASTGIYGGTDTSPLTDPTAIRNAVIAAAAGKIVYINPGPNGIDLSNINKGAGNPVRVQARDPSGAPVYIHPTQAQAGQTGCVYMNGASGIALLDMKLGITDMTLDYTPLIVAAGGSNLWFQRLQFVGTPQANQYQYGKAFVTASAGGSNLYFIDNTATNLNQGISTINVSGIECTFNTFQYISGDPIHLDGTINAKLIGNIGTDFRDVSLSHADMIQLATSASASIQGCAGAVIFMNGALGDPTQPLNGDSTKSYGRMQGITIQDDVFTGFDFSNILVQGNMFIGAEYASIQLGKFVAGHWSNIRVRDNDCIYCPSTIDTLPETRLAIGASGPEGQNVTSGDVTSNRAYKFLTASAVNMTGQISNSTDTSQSVANYAAAQTRWATWLALRAQYRTLAGL